MNIAIVILLAAGSVAAGCCLIIHTFENTRNFSPNEGVVRLVIGVLIMFLGPIGAIAFLFGGQS